MKAFQLLFFLCLLFILDCKSSKEVLKCAIKNIGSNKCNIFIESYRKIGTFAYGELAASKSAIANAINSCL